MHLKEIYLENFKSFGKKLSIPLLEGFTAVTGPNGSGKSNISDAILFVLGPKSSKAMRAGKLTDLIFNGGKEKKPATECKVSLIFDNKDRVIPVDSNEVTLTRRVKISPTNPDNYYSYFYVNNRAATQEDFDNLLAHARISGDGYNIVQQGDINRITQMTNLERRKLLDDIAGITRFDEEIAKAQEKRKALEENLARISIIQDEIERRLKQLEKERNDALKYMELKNKSTLAKATLAAKKRDGIKRDINSVTTEIEGCHTEIARFKSLLEDEKKKNERLKAELEDVEHKIVEKGGEETKELKEKIDKVRLEVFKARDGIESSRENIRKLKGEKTSAENDLKSVTKESNSLFEKKEEMEKIISQKSKEVQELERALREAQDQAAQSDSKIQQLQKESALAKKKIEDKEGEIHKNELERDRLEEKMQNLERDLANLEESIKTYEFEVKSIDFDLRELRKDSKLSESTIKEIQQEFFKKRNEEDKLSKKSTELELAIKRLQREYNQMKAQSEAAESLQRGYNLAVSTILEARDRGELKGVHGTIAELAEVDKEYETALSVAAGARMQSIVVEDDEIASKAIALLKSKNAGRATFLPLNKMIAGRPGGKALMTVKDGASLGFAIELVRFKPEYRAAFYYVFGDTIVVKDLANARRLMGGVRLVTLDGELIESSGAIIGGTLDKSQKLKFGAPSQTELERVAKELRDATEEADEVAKRLQALRTEVSALEGKLRELSNKGDSSISKIADLEVKRKEYDSKLDSFKKEEKEKRKEYEECKNALEILKHLIQDEEKELAVLVKDREEINKTLMKASPQELANKIKDLQNRLLNTSEEVRNLGAVLEATNEKLKIYAERREELSNRLSRIENDIKETEERIENLKSLLEAKDSELTTLLEVESKMGRELSELREKRDKLYKAKTEGEAKINEIHSKIDTNNDLILQLQARLQALEDKLTEFTREIESYNVNVTDTKISIENLMKTIGECEAGMKNLEPVNMLAIEEYEKQEKRKKEIDEEVKQLNAQREQLIKVVEELESKKKFGLFKVCDAINANFKEMYSILSNGGSA
ncbi:MAG: chromosome segregation protein SMC, partial [Thermoplasmata archaeon]